MFTTSSQGGLETVRIRNGIVYRPPRLAARAGLVSTSANSRSANFARHTLAHERAMVPVSPCRAGSSLLSKRLTFLKALDLLFRSCSKCSSCAEWDPSSQAISHEIIVGSCAGPRTRGSLQRERLTGTIASPRLGISSCCDHHGGDCDENGRSVHVDSPWV
jgi:hypothetical protein